MQQPILRGGDMALSCDGMRPCIIYESRAGLCNSNVTCETICRIATNVSQYQSASLAIRRHAKVRISAIKALRVTVMVPDRAKVKGAGTSAIVDLVGFREDNVLPVAAFYGRGDTTINYLAEVRHPRVLHRR